MLRSALARELKAAGFQRLQKVTLGWTRPAGDRHLSFWFQLDRFGWFDEVGSSFTLEFELSGKGERFLQLLDAEDREVVRAINNRILGGLRPLSPNHPALALSEEKRGWFLSAYKPDPEPYAAHRDIWLHYTSVADVAEWARFFQVRLPRMAATFEDRQR